ncbi:hypothetical protein PA598K_06840 [Paenibacillus sp. 598K]|uniref:carbamoyltransferase N-terminal domain-containing protein n=1 Tax=Paenibacillus sp. 598K TaxID=1117987 RepID=UPI000FFAA234|nr:carbamoyltransferase N-terminal domain-containing protein [Paenibacillus sp. 598K]GBF78224.1 hypothetical protein PA598K_06840 [Paenibacillus sp. 598K]
MRILGLSGGFNSIREDEPGNFNINQMRENAAAVLVENGKVIVAVEEERLNRIPGSNHRPVLAIQRCLSEAGLTLADIDRIAVYGEEKFYNHLLQRNYLADPSRYDTYATIRQVIRNYLAEAFDHRFDERSIVFVKHQHAHAVSAFACSGYESALVLSMDRAEDGFSGLVAKAVNDQWELIQTYHDTDSLVSFCKEVGEHIHPSVTNYRQLFQMSRHGDATPYRPYIKTCYELLPNGSYKLRFDPNALYEIMRLVPEADAAKQQCNLAASLQEMIETIVFHVIGHYRAVTGARRLCFAGELAANAALNAKLLQSGLFDELFIQPITHDAGAALGAALAQQAEGDDSGKRQPMEDLFWGARLASQDHIEAAAEQWGAFVAVQQAPRLTVAEQVASLLARREAVGWMQGRSEYGSFSLGNRSLLMHPYEAVSRIRDIPQPGMHSAPGDPLIVSIKESALHDYFEVPAAVLPSQFRFGNYLLAWTPGNDYMPEPHAYAQVHTVSASDNPALHQLLESFQQQTGFPFLIQSSLRNPAEPIVEAPHEAIALLVSGELGHLAIGELLLSRRETALPSLLQLRPQLPRYVTITQSIGYESPHRMARKAALVCPHRAADGTALSPQLYRLLTKADGRRSLRELLEPGSMEDSEQLERYAGAIRGLWQQRLLLLQPEGG